MPRFVLLEHDHPLPHLDLMLEAGATLDTWRLPQPPSPTTSCTATRIGQHRSHYLDYEGPVGGNRGHVRRWDAGVFEWLEHGEAVVEVRLAGGRLAGVLRLERQTGDEWCVRFRLTD